MDILTYKILHLIGVMGLFFSLGALIMAKESAMKSFIIMHGVSLLIVFISGFGMQAKGAMGFPLWMILKMVIWLLLGAFLVVAKRRLLPAVPAASICILLGAVAAWLALFKPFVS